MGSDRSPWLPPARASCRDGGGPVGGCCSRSRAGHWLRAGAGAPSWASPDQHTCMAGAARAGNQTTGAKPIPRYCPEQHRSHWCPSSETFALPSHRSPPLLLSRFLLFHHIQGMDV